MKPILPWGSHYRHPTEILTWVVFHLFLRVLTVLKFIGGWWGGGSEYIWVAITYSIIAPNSSLSHVLNIYLPVPSSIYPPNILIIIKHIFGIPISKPRYADFSFIVSPKAAYPNWNILENTIKNRVGRSNTDAIPNCSVNRNSYQNTCWSHLFYTTPLLVIWESLV